MARVPRTKVKQQRQPVGSVFDKLITKGVREGQIPARTQQARDWYRNATTRLKKRVDEGKLFESMPGRTVGSINVGSMYLFHYDPKHKDTLPYYDRLPLIFPFEKTKDGFMGINLHYLRPQMRAILMDGLYDLANNTRYDETTRLKLSYEVLKNVSKLSYYKPCVKRYLSNHVKSNFLYIHPTEWDIAIFLPLARFQKKSNVQVYNLSAKKV